MAIGRRPNGGTRLSPDEPPQPPYCPGNDGVVLLVDSGTAPPTAGRTTAGWCCGAWRCTPPMVRLQTSTVGSANRGNETMLSHSSVSACCVEAHGRGGVELLRGRLHQLVELAVRSSPSSSGSRSCPAAPAASCTCATVWLMYGREGLRQHRQVGEARRQDLARLGRAGDGRAASCPAPPPAARPGSPAPPPWPRGRSSRRPCAAGRARRTTSGSTGRPACAPAPSPR